MTGNAITVASVHAELTTQEAANILNEGTVVKTNFLGRLAVGMSARCQ